MTGEFKSMEILDVRWFTSGRGLVGVVRVEMDDADDAGPGAVSGEPQRAIRYFVGPVPGHDAAHDTREIADWGARFPEDAGALLFGRGA